MRICVVGLGYLGVTHSIAMALMGHEILGLDVIESRVSGLAIGKLDFFEPGLDENLKKMLEAGKVQFDTVAPNNYSPEVIFICVGTPQAEGSLGTSTEQIFHGLESVLPLISENTLVVGKSTVPVGTADRVVAFLRTKLGFDVEVAWNPEFLREGSALADSLEPDRLVIGASSSRGVAVLSKVYSELISKGVPVLSVNLRTSEMIKSAANSFLATKLSFINAIADLCEASGADVTQVAQALGYDERIGSKYLKAGLGYGGGCLPKDLRGLASVAGDLGLTSAHNLFTAVDEINALRRARVVGLAKQLLEGINEPRVLILGMTFKAQSDDLRDSPGLDIALELKRFGFAVTVHDPIAIEKVSRLHPDLPSEASILEAFDHKDLVILATDWREYSSLDPIELGKKVRTKQIIDGRHALNKGHWVQAGWKFYALGSGSTIETK